MCCIVALLSSATCYRQQWHTFALTRTLALSSLDGSHWTDRLTALPKDVTLYALLPFLPLSSRVNYLSTATQSYNKVYPATRYHAPLQDVTPRLNALTSSPYSPKRVLTSLLNLPLNIPTLSARHNHYFKLALYFFVLFPLYVSLLSHLSIGSVSRGGCVKEPIYAMNDSATNQLLWHVVHNVSSAKDSSVNSAELHQLFHSVLQHHTVDSDCSFTYQAAAAPPQSCFLLGVDVNSIFPANIDYSSIRFVHNSMHTHLWLAILLLNSLYCYLPLVIYLAHGYYSVLVPNIVLTCRAASAVQEMSDAIRQQYHEWYENYVRVCLALGRPKRTADESVSVDEKKFLYWFRNTNVPRLVALSASMLLISVVQTWLSVFCYEYLISGCCGSFTLVSVVFSTVLLLQYTWFGSLTIMLAFHILVD